MAQEELAGRALLAEVRRALHHLYDPVELRKSPLIGLLKLESHSALRQLLEQSVSSLQPAAGVSQQSDAWRTFRVLHHRFIEQFDQNDVAGNLSLSIRQLRRQEGVALQTITDVLCERFGLDCAADADPDGERGPDAATSAENELALAERAYPSRPTDLGPVLDAVLETIRPMAEGLGVMLEVSGLSAHMPARVNASAQPLRQALLTMLPGVLQHSQGRTAQIAVTRGEAHVHISMSAAQAPQDLLRLQDTIEMAQRLLALCQGALTIGDEGRVLTCQLPLAETLPVLVVDDNIDAHALFARFLADSRYQPIASHNAAQAEALLRTLTPRAIILDVMLPEVDGWEVLGRLRENPHTAHIPVIVCTILPQEQLALTLSAAAFLRKPVKQAQLLALLDQMVGASATESQ